MKFGLIFPIGMILFGSYAAAQLTATDYSIHQNFVSVRAVGMGNAFTAVVDDTSAFFYNPAALGRRKDSELKFSLDAGMDTKTLGLESDIKKAEDQSNSTDKINSLTSLLESNYGNYYSLRAPVVGAFDAWPHWEVAFIPADLDLEMNVHQCVGPCLNVNGYLDSTLAMSYGHDVNWLKGHEISWGVTLKAVHRVYAGQLLQASDLVQGTQIFNMSDAKEGLTFDADVGTLWTPYVPQHGFFSFFQYLKPTFAVVGQNLIDYGFKTNPHWISAQDSGNPPPLGRRLDLGSKWDLPKLWVFDPHIGVDERDIGDDNWTLRKGFHTGAELWWTMYHWWRGYWSVGCNQGYLTLGVGARLAWFQFSLATYGEEVGTPAEPLESRRYLAELALDF